MTCPKYITVIIRCYTIKNNPFIQRHCLNHTNNQLGILSKWNGFNMAKEICP